MNLNIRLAMLALIGFMLLGLGIASKHNVWLDNSDASMLMFVGSAFIVCVAGLLVLAIFRLDD